jgi:hypothetical protein
VCLSYIYIPLKQRSAVIGGDLLAAWIPSVPIFPSFPFLLSSGGSLKGQPRKKSDYYKGSFEPNLSVTGKERKVQNKNGLHWATFEKNYEKKN